MPASTRTGEQIFQALSEMLNDWETATTTALGNSGGTTATATNLRKHGDDRLQGRWLRQRIATYPVRKVSSNTQSTGTVTLAEPFAAQVASGVVVEAHKYDPLLKWRALEQARLEIMDDVYRIIIDDTITSDGSNNVYDIPSTVVQGPHLVYTESPAPAMGLTWNFLAEPIAAATTGWTAVSMTVADYDRSDIDLLVPKYETRAQKFTVAASTNGTQSQVVADAENGITAAAAAGRRMTFARWVYCNVASKVTLKIIDDAGTATGDAHQGRGWELLTVEKTISATNTTLLTVRMDVANSAGAVAGYYERGWFYYGDKERLIEPMYNWQEPVRVRTDATQQHIILNDVPLRGRQIRLQGKAPLSSLGTDPDTQMTSTTEVDERSEKLYVARAAELLLEWGALGSDNVQEIITRIQAIKGRGNRLEQQWGPKAERYHVRSPFA